jgi:hypothetical protein
MTPSVGNEAYPPSQDHCVACNGHGLIAYIIGGCFAHS